ncbi:hypothetical protein [Sphingobacterium detergens]|uniref:hypothetical protein n=1 Tax=Sphingobacterium detergens TaxID=1145106 RepID=UPI003AABF88D
MKENLDNAGVARKVALLLALTAAERAIELRIMTDNFAAWMEQNFKLKSYQLAQLNNLPAEFRKQLGHAISNYLMQGYVLQFQKDEKEAEDPDFKELVVHGLEQWQDVNMEMALTPLFIRISYRDPQR